MRLVCQVRVVAVVFAKQEMAQRRMQFGQYVGRAIRFEFQIGGRLDFLAVMFAARIERRQFRLLVREFQHYAPSFNAVRRAAAWAMHANQAAFSCSDFDLSFGTRSTARSN